MTVISRITTQQKNTGRYNIFLEEANQESYGFSVDEDVLITYNLHKGMELDQALMDEIEKEDSKRKAYNMAIHYLSYRMRSEKELTTYLVQKEIPEMYIAEVMEKLTQKGLINDGEFAEAFVSSRIHTSTKGPQIIKKELRDKGIQEDIISKAMAQYTYQEQVEKAEKLLQKKAASSVKKSHQQKVHTLKNHLLQKGFTHDVIQDVTTAHVFEKDDAAEWDALVHHGTKQLKKLRGKYSGRKRHDKLKESLYRKGFSFSLIQSFLETYATNIDSDEEIQ